MIIIAARTAGAQAPPTVDVAIALSDAISTGESGEFIVPKSTAVTWQVTVQVTNPRTDAEYTDVLWFNRYEDALLIHSVSSDRGALTYSDTPPNEIEWKIGTLGPGQTARLSFRLSTRTTAEGRQLYSELGCAAWESGAELHYSVEGQSNVQLQPGPSPRQRCVVEGPPWIAISLSTRKDWWLRRPGCFASEAFFIELASNAGVSVSFDGFGALERLDDPSSPAIPTWYSFGEDFAEALWTGWIPAADFNGVKWTYAKSAALEAGVSERSWNHVCIGPEHVASEYENTGTITIALNAGSTHVDP